MDDFQPPTQHSPQLLIGTKFREPTWQLVIFAAADVFIKITVPDNLPARRLPDFFVQTETACQFVDECPKSFENRAGQDPKRDLSGGTRDEREFQELRRCCPANFSK